MKKQKVGKKERFKRLKNKKEAVYQAPAFLAAKGILAVSESGIMQYGGNFFAKTYEMDFREETAGAELMQNLRSLNYPFDVLNVFGGSGGEEILHFRFWAKAENFIQAQEAFESLDKEFLSLGFAFHSMNFVKKISNFFSCMESLGKKEKEEPFTEVFQHTGFLKECMQLDFIKEESNQFQTEKGVWAFVSVNHYPSDPDASIFDIFSEFKGLTSMYVSIEPISDFAVSDFIEERYIGFEGLLSRMKRKNPELYQVLEREPETDKKQFFCGESVFLISGETQEIFQELLENLQKKAEEKGYEIRRLYGGQKNKLLDFFLLGGGIKSESRFQSVKNISCLLPCAAGDSTERKEYAEEAYDIEEMRKLFLS